MAVDRQLILRFWQLLAGCHAQLPLHQVGPGDHLGHRMLDLQTRVHFHEIERAILVGDKFNRARADVAHRVGRRHRRIAHRRAALGGHARRRRFLQHFLVAALHRAVALVQVDAVAKRIGKHLNLNVARALHVFFSQHLVVAKGADCFALARRQRRLEVFRTLDHAHALAAAAGRCLEQHRVADAVALLLQKVGVLIVAVVAGHQRHVRLFHQCLGGRLGTHRPHGGCRRPNEHQSRCHAGIRELRVLRQEAIARMDRLRPGSQRHGDDFVAAQVAFLGRGWADQHRLIAYCHVF